MSKMAALRCGPRYSRIAMIPRCHWCREALGRVFISMESKEHILEKHYDLKNSIDVSVFYPNVDLQSVFEIFKAKLRSGILEAKYDYSTRHVRLVYRCSFAFVVGTFPIKHRWGITTHETCYSRVVCDTSRCPRCHRLVPTMVTTAFPDGRPH